jgi:hypothetical protein
MRGTDRHDLCVICLFYAIYGSSEYVLFRTKFYFDLKEKVKIDDVREQNHGKCIWS